MALTGTDRGAAASNASSSTTYAFSPASNFTAGALAVVCISADNSASGGSSNNINTVTDTKGNTWTKRCSALYDPGAANAGIQGAIFTSPQDGGTLTTGDTITVTFGAATTAKSYTLMEVTGSVGTPAYKSQNVNTGSGTASPTVTTSSIPNGQMVIGALFNEYGTAQTVTQDGDTTNGSWSTQQTAEVGSTTSGNTISSQRKVVTATATQTFNPTLGTSSDVILGWISVGEDIAVTPSALALTTTTYAPTVAVTTNVLVTPVTAALTTTRYAPTVIAPAPPLPSGDSVEIGHTLYGTDWADISSAPSGGTIVSMWTRIPETEPSGYPWGRGNLETFLIGDSEWYLRCIVGNIGITDASTATYNANVMLFAELDGDHVGDWVADYAYYNGAHTEAEVRGWVWVAWQVVVEASQFRFRQWLKFGTGGSVFLAAESTVTFTDVRTILAGLGWSSGDQAAWTPGQPNYIRVGTDQNNAHVWHVRIDEGTSAPSLSALDDIALATSYDYGAWADWAFSWHTGAADIDDGSGNGRDLTIESGGALYKGNPTPWGYLAVPPVRAVTTTRYSPRVGLGVTPAPASLTIATYAPTVTTGGGSETVTPPTASLTTARFAPTVQAPRVCTPPAASLATASFAPTVQTPAVATPGPAALASTALAPAVLTPRVVTPAAAAMTTAAFAPTVTGGAGLTVTPPAASLATARFAPTVQAPRTVTPTATALTIATYAPTILTPRAVTPPVAALLTANLAPTVLAPRVCAPTALAITTTTYAPTVTSDAGVIVEPGPAALTTTRYAPTVLAPQTCTPPAASLTTTRYAPMVATPRLCAPAPAALSLAFLAPTVATTAHVTVTPPTASLVTTMYAPQGAQPPVECTPPTLALLTQPYAPHVYVAGGLFRVRAIRDRHLIDLPPRLRKRRGH